jgi:hypothetical protein
MAAPRHREECPVLERVDFEVTRAAPSLQHYRRDWAPGSGVGLAGIWLGAVV